MNTLQVNETLRARAFEADLFNTPLDLTVGNPGGEFEMQLNLTMEQALELRDFITANAEQWAEQLADKYQHNLDLEEDS